MFLAPFDNADMRVEGRALHCVPGAQYYIMPIPVFLVRSEADNSWARGGEIKMERTAIMETLLHFCNEHKKWKHIRYYPALVNLSMLHASTSYKIENLKMAVNVSRRACVGRIVINFLKVLLMGGLRSNLIILSPLHRLYQFSLVEICEKIS